MTASQRQMRRDGSDAEEAASTPPLQRRVVEAR